MITTSAHPFKDGINHILVDHLGTAIASRFFLLFEQELYNKDVKSIWLQKKDNVQVMEVRYKNPDDTSEYICDIWSTWPKKRCEIELLRHITDKLRANKIGHDWVAVSKDIHTAKYETPYQKTDN